MLPRNRPQSSTRALVSTTCTDALAHQALHAWRQHCSASPLKAVALTCAARRQGRQKTLKLRKYQQTMTMQRAWRNPRLGRRAAKQTPRLATGAGLGACRQSAVFRRWACTACGGLQQQQHMHPGGTAVCGLCKLYCTWKPASSEWHAPAQGTVSALPSS